MTKKIRATYKILETINLNQIENYSITKNQWSWISQHKQLSENFIDKFQDKVEWNNISWFQKLSENFIDKFQDKVDWYCISCKQDLSNKFVSKYRDRLRMEEVNKRRNERIRRVIENALK